MKGTSNQSLLTPATLADKIINRMCCTIQSTTNFEAEIRQDGKTVLGGDKTSIAVVFNNMTGKNMSAEEYRNYKKFIQTQGVRLSSPVEHWEDGVFIRSGVIK